MTTTRARPTGGNGSTAVATREAEAPPATRATHPIVVAIEERMSAIAEMLPEGMSAQRFRRVVVQALVRNPDLLQCTPVSVITAITEAAEAGLEPTGVLGKAWMLPYNVNVGSSDNPRWEKQAKLIPGWRGFVDLAWRADRILVAAEVVREGDAFEYRRGTGAYLHHTPLLDDPEREANDNNITYAYVLVRFPDGREDFEVMSRAALERIRDRAKKKNPVWVSDFGEMAKKTPVRRIAKRLPLSPAVQRILAGDEEVDFDTPVERVGATNGRAEGLRERIHGRTAALRGDVLVEDPPPAEPDPEDAVDDPVELIDGQPVDVDDIPFEQAAEDPSVAGGREAPAVTASAAPGCLHPAGAQVLTGAGVTCGDCGEVLARRSAASRPAARQRSYRESLMARIHVDRSHDQARTLSAAVLGLDTSKEWSMADLDENQLAMVVGALEGQAAAAAKPRRQPATAGRSR